MPTLFDEPEDGVELKGGLFVRTDAVVLALELAERGHTLSEKDGLLMVSNGAALTAADRAAIAKIRMHLLAIAGYEPPALS